MTWQRQQRRMRPAARPVSLSQCLLDSSLDKPLADASNSRHRSMRRSGDLQILQTIGGVVEGMGAGDLTRRRLALASQRHQLGPFIWREVDDVLFAHGEAIFPPLTLHRSRSLWS